MKRNGEGCEIVVSCDGEPTAHDTDLGPAHSLMLGMSMALQMCTSSNAMRSTSMSGHEDICSEEVIHNLEYSEGVCSFTTNLPTTWSNYMLHANDLFLPIGTALQRVPEINDQFTDGLEICTVKRFKIREEFDRQANLRISLNPMAKEDDETLEIQLQTKCGKAIYVYGSKADEIPLDRHSNFAMNPYIQAYARQMKALIGTTRESNATEWICPIPPFNYVGNSVEHPCRDINTMLETINILMGAIGTQLRPPGAASGAVVGTYKNCEILDSEGLQTRAQQVEIHLKKSINGSSGSLTVFSFEIKDTQGTVIARGEGIGGFSHPLVIKESRFHEEA